MYFSGGMIPTYLTVRGLGLLNTWWALIIPAGCSTYNLIVARTFFANGVPSEIEEAAIIDGCSTFRVFFQIVLPLSKALIGVLTLYYGVAHWNEYFRAFNLPFLCPGKGTLGTGAAGNSDFKYHEGNSWFFR